VITVARQVVVRRVDELEDTTRSANTGDGDPEAVERPGEPGPDKAED